ncbi:MAG: imidazolonepropionase [Bacteroidales bacterium]|nr:imidazolonepropionase [Bacteroidales bacterium]
MRTLVTDIGLLAGIGTGLRKEGLAMSEVGCLKDAWLLIDGEVIAGFGAMADRLPSDVDETADVAGRMVIPAFCDSHTHAVWAGSREREFEDKIRGLSYAEIAANGGGILNSADLLHRTGEDELFAQSIVRVREMMAAGSGAIEIKSGYGLSTEDELKMLRVIRRIREEVPAVVKSTFLGAHAVARGMTRENYVRLVCDEMIPAVAAERLADFVDVFCEEGFFTPEDTALILETAARYGLRPKLHANQLAVSGGVQVAVAHGALSADHLERTTRAEIECFKGSGTMPTMLPGASFFLREPYGNARGFIDAGLGVALASDYNPGTSPSGDMRFVMALGCIQMRLTPEQAFNAVTINSAYAMGVSDIAGSIASGKLANIIVTRPGFDSIGSLAYRYSTPFIEKVILRGKSL